jgi:hypothetical protein
MPLTAKGRDIMAAMKEQYGEAKGEEVFYKSKNAGTITGVDSEDPPNPTDLHAKLDAACAKMDAMVRNGWRGADAVVDAICDALKGRK